MHGYLLKSTFRSLDPMIMCLYIINLQLNQSNYISIYKSVSKRAIQKRLVHDRGILKFYGKVIKITVLDFCCFRFEPFSRRDSRYEPLLHTRSEYGHLPYGFRYFREEFPDRRVTQQVCHESFCYQHGNICH